MSTLNELEIRLKRVEKRWDESDQEFHDAMNEVANFQERITRATALAAAVAAAVAFLFMVRHWLDMGGIWPQLFSIAMGGLTYAILAGWLDRWRVRERDELRRKYYPSGEPKGEVVTDSRGHS